MAPWQQIALFIIGCISLALGIGLLAWSAVQKKTAAGVDLKDVTAFLKVLAKLVDAFARYFPDQAARIGWALIVVGLMLIFGPLYV